MSSESPVYEAIDPTSLIKPEWVLSQRTLRSGAFVVEHHIETPETLESKPISQHLMSVTLKGVPRQLTRFGELEFEGATQTGDFWLLPALSLSALWSWDSCDETIMFYLDRELLEQIAIESDCARVSGLELQPLVYGHNRQILSLAQAFQTEMTQASVGSQLYTDALALQFIIHLLREHATRSLTPRDYAGGLSRHQTKYLLDYINANLDRSIYLEELAKLLNMSQFHFSRLFKRSNGISPHQFVIQQRVERAKQLLEKSDSSILEVAMHCGFTDGSHLTRHFRKLTGATPTVYRQRL